MLFVSFEGVDGSGKTTQISLLEERLVAEGRTVLRCREPGGTDLGEAVRSLLLDPAMAIEPMAELLLFSAARAQLVASRIRPALADGTIVICDRFFDSTTVYQGHARGLGDLDWMSTFHERVTGGLVPDRTYVLDISPDLAGQRRDSRPGRVDDRMEGAGPEFLGRVVNGYRTLAQRHPGRIRLIDANRDVGAIAADIWADFARILAGGTAA